MGRTTVCLEPRKVRSMHVDGELMDKQVGAQLSLHFSELMNIASCPNSELVMYICPACMDRKGLVCFQLCADVLNTVVEPN